VTLHDGIPVPKVIDFGVAKATQGRLTDQTYFTRFEQFIGTPAYMSPEQAEMSGLDIDTRSDVYSLGVLSYELLAGRPPFAQDLSHCQHRRDAAADPGGDREPSRLCDPDRGGPDDGGETARHAPAQLSTVLAGDLDWIVMRCLEKDRTRPTPPLRTGR